MSFASMTRGSPPDERHDVNDDETGHREATRERDALKEAEARRLDRLELERAANEGMPAPASQSQSDDHAQSDDDHS